MIIKTSVCFLSNITIIDTNGNLVVKYEYTAYGKIISITGSLSGTIGQYNPFRYKGYYYDRETNMYYCNSRYYVPEWCRWLTIDSVEYLEPGSINGLNLYTYCSNNPKMFKQEFNSLRTVFFISSISISRFVSRAINKSGANYIAGVFLLPNVSNLNLFGYEWRTSARWNNSPEIASSWFGRIGFSSYITHMQGQPGALYAFAGGTADILNWFDTTYYAGVGINLFNIIGAEVQLETLGIGAQVNLGNLSIGANINIIGGTSAAFGWNTDLGKGFTRTDGFTIGVNTGFLLAVIIWIYKAVTTGDTSPVPGLVPA